MQRNTEEYQVVVKQIHKIEDKTQEIMKMREETNILVDHIMVKIETLTKIAE